MQSCTNCLLLMIAENTAERLTVVSAVGSHSNQGILSLAGSPDQKSQLSIDVIGLVINLIRNVLQQAVSLERQHVKNIRVYQILPGNYCSGYKD